KQFYNEQQKYGINKHAIMLKEVKIKSKKDFVKRSENLNGPGNADEIITADELKTMVGATLAFCLKGKLFGLVAFTYKGVAYSTRPLDKFSPAQPMLLVVDGGYLDPEELNNVNPDRIQSIEVLISPNYATVYGTRGGFGVLVITTKRGSDYERDRFTPGVVAYHPKGFYKAREFYSPQYDDPKTNLRIGDYRSTICWKPDLITDKDGKASFSFFNSDNKGTYRVVIEGIDADGNIGRQVYRYTVK
ncbi:MAG: TonB-dependent receptor, partial [Mucilaginibacter sp.]